jgi:hypothetical protein
MPVEKLTSDKKGGVTEEFLYDHTDDVVGVRWTQDVEPVLKEVSAKRLHGVKAVDGLGYLIGEIPEAVAIKYANFRGISPWTDLIYKPEYADEMRKLCMMNPAFNPSGKAVL